MIITRRLSLARWACYSAIAFSSAVLCLVVPSAARAEEQPWFSFSYVMDQLSKNQGFIDALVERIGRDPRAGGILGPEHTKRLREILLGKQFEALDTFPTMTVREMGRAVDLAARAMTPAEQAGAAAAVPSPPAAAEEALGIPSADAPPPADRYLRQIGFDLAVGDRIDETLASRFADGSRLAAVMNRLARNAPGEPPAYRVRIGEVLVSSGEQLLTMLVSQGHHVEVRDARYFANFGDLIYQGRDVLTPFWLDTEILVPGQERTLRVPASHSQHELGVRGPLINADLAFFFGIDGLAELRPIVTKDQAWTYGRVARTYRGADVLEVMRFVAAIIRTYDRVKAEHPALPFGGYYALGVCNDVNAMIEMHMQGETTLFPLTHDPALFTGQSEVDHVVHRLPVDGSDDSTPDVRRILGSLPVDNVELLALPSVRDDLTAVRSAFAQGTVGYAQSSSVRFWARLAALGAIVLLWMKPLLVVGVVLVLLVFLWLGRRIMRRRTI